MDEQCNKCKFWKQHTHTPNYGICRFDPPKAVAMSRVETSYPVTQPADWCGKFQVGLATKGIQHV